MLQRIVTIDNNGGKDSNGDTVDDGAAREAQLGADARCDGQR